MSNPFEQDINYNNYVTSINLLKASEEGLCPSAIYRPSLGRDGNKWSALYGDNIMEGVVGYGDSPAEAMADFNANWIKKI